MANRIEIVGLILSLSLVSPKAYAKDPTATVESGMVIGFSNDSADTFLGIPYAAPPIGDLRWRAPQLAKAWANPRPAKSFGHDCMQEPFPSDAAPLGTSPAEDCLTVNIWRPKGTSPTAKLPVLVWIYGGGEVNGGASPAVYSGKHFARDGVVFVSFNYRVGRFGFFAFPELTRLNADGGLLGNYGDMDVLAAMRWVERNIAAFGGDPNQVTIAGQSAGASRVVSLLTSSEARGLIARAIIQSGGGGSVQRPPFKDYREGAVSIEQAGINFAQRWSIKGTDAQALAELRALTAEQVTDGIHLGTRTTQASTFVGAVTDGRLVTGSMVARTLAGEQAPVPLMIGGTTGDNFALMQAKTLSEAYATVFAANAAQARDAYAPVPGDDGHVLREMGRDMSYFHPARNIASAYERQGIPAYVYRFGYVPSPMLSEWREGPLHATDIPFSMDTLAAKYGRNLSPKDMKIAAIYHEYWLNFVKSGDPNGPGLPRWPVYEKLRDEIMIFKPDGSVSAEVDPHKSRLDAVDSACKCQK